MYYKIIELSPKTPSISYDETKDLIWHFLCALESNGQILKNYKVIQNINFMLYVTTPKKDSLSECHDSVYVKNDREKIGEYFNLQIKDCGIDLESQEYCSCKTRSAMEMQTFRFDIDSVFTCCDCGNLLCFMNCLILKTEKITMTYSCGRIIMPQWICFG